MNEENELSDDRTGLSPLDRRGLIKQSATGVAGISLLPGMAVADQKNDGIIINGDEYVTDTNHQEEEYYYSTTYNNWYRIESTVRCLGGYDKSNGMWGTTFRNCAYGVARRYDPNNETPEEGKKIDVLDEHTIGYADADDGNTSTFGYKYDDGYLGGWPAPQMTYLEIGESTLEEFFKVAMGSLNDVASLILGAVETYQNVSNEINDNESSTSGENKTFSWYYGDGWTSDEHSDVAHFSEVDYEQSYDTTSTFYVESDIYDGSVNPQVNWKVEVDAPSSTSTSTISTSSDPYSKETKKKFGLRKVPIQELEEAGINVSNPRIVDGNKVWFATKPQLNFTRVSPDESPL